MRTRTNQDPEPLSAPAAIVAAMWAGLFFVYAGPAVWQSIGRALAVLLGAPCE